MVSDHLPVNFVIFTFLTSFLRTAYFLFKKYGAVILHECCYVLQYCDCLKPLSSVLNIYVYACVYVMYNPYARV